MREIDVLSTDRLQDAAGSYFEAARIFENNLRVEESPSSSAEHHNDGDSVPHLDFSITKERVGLGLVGRAQVQQIDEEPTIVLMPVVDATSRHSLAGLRGMAVFDVEGTKVIRPAVLCDDGAAAVLVGDARPDPKAGFTGVQHALLDIEYHKHRARADVSATHDDHDIPTVTSMAPALIVASSLDVPRTHQTAHDLATTTHVTGGNGPNMSTNSLETVTFGQKFSAARLQDFDSGHGKREVRSRVLAPTEFTFLANERQQVPPVVTLELTGSDLAVGLTLIARATRARDAQIAEPDFAETMRAMTGN